MVQALLKAGANPRAADISGLTALHYAAALGKTGVVKELLKAGARVDVRDSRGVTPLHLAVAGGHTATVKLLLQAGADPNAGFAVDGRALQATRDSILDNVEVWVIEDDRPAPRPPPRPGSRPGPGRH